jgi:hypothetical protein
MDFVDVPLEIQRYILLQFIKKLESLFYAICNANMFVNLCVCVCVCVYLYVTYMSLCFMPRN